MLLKKYRLKKEKDFEAVFKKGRLLQNSFFVIRFLKSGGGGNKFGIVVSSKVSKKATERNKIKRRIWSFIKENKDLFKKSFNFAIIVKKSAMAANKEDLKINFENLFFKEDLFIKN